MKCLSDYLVEVDEKDGYRQKSIAHWCPACKYLHQFSCFAPQANGAQWSFDGNLDLPTFLPSMNRSTGPFPDGKIFVCHYFLRNGMLEYQNDCTHEYKGVCCPLPELPKQYQPPFLEMKQ